MKSTKVEVGVPNPVWPCLMTIPLSDKSDGGDKGVVVLFTSEGTGTVVHEGPNTSPLGYHTSFWTMDRFIPFIGTITLENGL